MGSYYYLFVFVEVAKQLSCCLKLRLLQEGLIANTIRNFETNTNLNILNLVGEVIFFTDFTKFTLNYLRNCFFLKNSSKDMFYYESLFEAQTVFLNQNNEKTLTNIDKLKLLWEVSLIFVANRYETSN